MRGLEVGRRPRCVAWPARHPVHQLAMRMRIIIGASVSEPPLVDLTYAYRMAPCAMDSSAMEGAVHSHRDFRVRRSVVHRALNWLVTHNQYYRSNHVHIDVNALEQLPHAGNLSQLTAITVESAITEPPATNTPVTGPPVADTPATSEDPYSAHLPQSFVPFATRSMTEQEAVHQSVQE